MKKRLASLLLAALLLLALAVPALASVNEGYFYTVAEDSYNESYDLRQIPAYLDAKTNSLGFDFRVDIVSSTEDYSIEEYAALFYEQYEYGYGPNKDGMLLMIRLSGSEDDYYIEEFTLHGEGEGEALLDGGLNDTLRTLLFPVLSGGMYGSQETGDRCAEGIRLFVDTLADALNSDASREVILPVETETATETAGGSSLADGLGSVLIRDKDGLLTSSQQQELEAKAQAIANQYGCNLYVLTVDSLDGQGRRSYAEQYYTDNNLGYGSWRDGVLFLVAMGTREYVTVTWSHDPNDWLNYGTAINAFTDYGIAEMEDEIVPKLSDGDYYGAFDRYLSIGEKYLKAYAAGKPFDVGSKRNTGIAWLVIIAAPLVIALIACLKMRADMKPIKPAANANKYVPDDGLNLYGQTDQFTHTTVTRRRIERESSGGGHSGGSSVSSSGFGGSSGGHF